MPAHHGAPEVKFDAASQPPRRRPHRLRQVLLAVVVTLALALGLAGVGGSLLVRRFDHAVEKVTLLAPSARAGAPAGQSAVAGPLNFLLIGSDYRDTNPEEGQRSDTIIIAHVSRALDRVYLISIPRDLLVDIPAVPELEFGGDTTKINAAFEYGRGGRGGAQLLSITLTDLAGVRFDGAAAIDFSGLRSAVDILGGVELCVDTAVVSIHTSVVFEPGCRVMASKDVLDYLRQRDFPDGDFSRQRHQQQFLKAFLDRALSVKGVLTNPLRLDALLRAIADSLTLDTGGMSLADLVFAMRNLRSDGVLGVRVPTYSQMINDLSFVVATDGAHELFDAIRTDTLDGWAATHDEWVNKI